MFIPIYISRSFGTILAAVYLWTIAAYVDSVLGGGTFVFGWNHAILYLLYWSFGNLIYALLVFYFSKALNHSIILSRQKVHKHAYASCIVSIIIICLIGYGEIIDFSENVRIQYYAGWYMISAEMLVAWPSSLLCYRLISNQL